MKSFDKGTWVWLFLIVGLWLYFGIYAPSHPPKPSAVDVAKEQKRKAENAYVEAHPEENETYAILSAKYGIPTKSAQIIIESFSSNESFERKDKQALIADIAVRAGVSAQIVASVLVDHSYLTSDCSQPE